MEYNRDFAVKKLINGLDQIEIRLSDYQLNQFINYYDLLIEWNKVMNLTAITEISDVINKHFIDSLSIVKALRPEKQKILDLGTGAGFPGVPIKIAFPETDILLMDSLNKRIQFLNEVIKSLHLEKITAIHGRAEELGHQGQYREQFDLCTSRAVAKLATLSEYCIPFVKKNGYFISYKSGKAEEELIEASTAIKRLGAKVESKIEFNLPNTDIERTIILIKKIENTNKKYPRSSGKPSKEPL